MDKRATLSLSVTERQAAFLSAEAGEVLFGGAAGGGKSYGQLIDALLYALKYPGSKQLILRRTYAELEKSLIRVSQGLYPRSVYSYNASAHVGRFRNGSLIDFGYSAIESDVFQYQSAEYDVIRFDELTHFTEFQYLYMLSRLRGANGYPKQVKSSTNPGGIGHAWVKARFVDPAPPGETIMGDSGTRLYLPSRIDDNPFLAEGDPGISGVCSRFPRRSVARSSMATGIFSADGISPSFPMKPIPYSPRIFHPRGENTAQLITVSTASPAFGSRSTRKTECTFTESCASRITSSRTLAARFWRARPHRSGSTQRLRPPTFGRAVRNRGARALCFLPSMGLP